MKRGFTLIEVMIALAIVGGLLVTLIYTINYNLGIAQRHEFITKATLLAKEKIIEAETTMSESKGTLPPPYEYLRFETEFKDSKFPGVSELWVKVTDGKDEITLVELVLRKR